MYGYTIKSSRFSNYSNYLVITDDITVASELIKTEVENLLSFEDGWTWGNPTISQLSTDETKQLTTANLIWE